MAKNEVSTNEVAPPADVAAAKTVTLTFGSNSDLALYSRLKSDADNDDRSISLFILRYLRGYKTDLD